MSSLAAFRFVANAASNGIASDAYRACRDMKLPATADILPRVRAVQAHYRRATGRALDTEAAIRVLDRLRAEREDVPIPMAYTAVASFLADEGFDTDEIHAIVGHLSRGGAAAGLRGLDPWHRDQVRRLMPKERPTRGSWGRDEDEDEEGN